MPDARNVTWADDLAAAQSNSLKRPKLPCQVRLAAKFCVREDSMHTCLSWPGCKSQRLHWYGMPSPALTLNVNLCDSKQLRIVAKYKHLGSLITLSTHFASEIAARIAQARAAYHRFRSSIFQNIRRSLSKRVQLFAVNISVQCCYVDAVAQI